MGQSLALQRLIARLTGLFGLIGLSLACVGVYGIMSDTVAQQTREMGIRLALGARRRDIIRLLLGEALRPALGGVAIGLAVSFAATRLVASQLFGLVATDPAKPTSRAAALGGSLKPEAEQLWREVKERVRGKSPPQ